MRLERLRWRRVDACSLSPSIVGFTDKDALPDKPDVGQTFFYRFAQTQFAMARWAIDNQDRPLRVLFAPCSVGCEPYTFATIMTVSGAYKKHPKLAMTLDAFDISAKFSTLARRAIYPKNLFRDVHSSVIAAAGTRLGRLGRYIKLNDDIKNRVNILPAADLLTFEITQPYDVVMAANIICHLTPEENLKLAENLVRLGQSNIIVNGFQRLQKKDPDAAKAFLAVFEKAGFTMVPHRFELGRGKPEPIYGGMILFERAQPHIKPLSLYLNGYPK